MAMNIEIKCTIPIKESYLEFLKVKTGQDVKNGFYDPTKTKCNFSDYLMLVFSSDYRSLGSNSVFSSGKYNAELEIKVPTRMVDSNRINISDAFIIRIDEFIRKEFYNELTVFIEMAAQYKITRKEAILKFMDKYNLHDFNSFDALEKWAQRNLIYKKDK